MSGVQASTGLRKQEKPHLYCPSHACLWMTGDGRPCPRHGGPVWTKTWEELARLVSRGDITVDEAHAREEAT